MNLNYIEVVSKISDIGKYVGQMLKFLINQGGMKESTTTLVGHSMGAHVVGIAGNYIRKNIDKQVKFVFGKFMIMF